MEEEKFAVGQELSSLFYPHVFGPAVVVLVDPLPDSRSLGR